MKIPLSWLRKYVPVDLPVRELAHRLTMAGNEVGEVEFVGGDWERDKLVVGHVLKVEPHPNADRLSLPTVELGNGETATVVCGAPNVAAGQKIAFAREGARIFSPRSGKTERLKRAKIRGVESAGMVCSPLELGMGDDHDGILTLPDDALTGTPLADYLGDAVLDVEVTPNRPDCLSVLGIAHEVAAITGGSVAEPDLSYPEDGPPIEELVSIEIANPELCGRYTASFIRGVRIGESPQWMQDALIRAGQRPINNVVDITNYVMIEYGQPLHAFDFDNVRDSRIVVRAARPGETLETLDGVRRALNPPMLCIADSHDAIGLAGVMGGASTEMDENTTSVLLEAASFDPVNTRRTRTALRMNTEASYRFERAIRAELAERGLRRATALIIEIAGGAAAKGIVDLYPGRKPTPTVRLSRRRVRQVLGVDYSVERMREVLDSLGFERAPEPSGLIDVIEAVEAGPAPERRDTIWVHPPYWRSDVSIEDDLVEEVARVTGYDSIPTTMLAASIPHHLPQSLRELKERVRDCLAESGMRETITYSCTTLEMLESVGAVDESNPPLRIANPMSADFEYLRTSLRGAVLGTLAANRRNAQSEGIRIFELGRVYLPKLEAKERDLPNEREMLVGVVSGPRSTVSWLTPQGDMGFFDAKGVLEALFGRLDFEVEYEPCESGFFRQGRAARLTCGGASVGEIGEVRPDVLTRFDLEDAPVALFEVDVEGLAQVMPDTPRRYRRTSRFPVSNRDVALVMDAAVPSSRVQSIIARHKMVANSAPFDVYSGEGVPKGKKSVAYRIEFRSDRETLTSEQVDRYQSDILRQLRRELGAELRV